MKKRVRSKCKGSSFAVHGNAIQVLRTNLSRLEGHLQELSSLLGELFSDENFLTLLRAEGLITMPKWIHEHLK